MKKLILHFGNETIKVVDLAQILYVTIEDRSAHLFYVTNGKTEVIRTRKSLKEFEERLEKSGFVRAHKGFLVAVDHIQYVDRSMIQLNDRDKTRIPLGPKYKNNVISRLRQGNVEMAE